MYHYTTLGGLQGIINSGRLWMSDVRFMNDASELTYATELINDEVHKVLNDPAHQGLLTLLDGYERLPSIFDWGLRPFIACFCEADDLLSQWRGYGQDDAPVSLKLDFRGFVAFDLQNAHFTKVVYPVEEQRALVREAMTPWLSTVGSLLGEGYELAELSVTAVSALMHAMTEYPLFFKHPTFSEEREWRLIRVVDTREGGNEILFRPSMYGLTPYIEIPIQRSAGAFPGRVPLDSVRQGPRAHAELALQSLAGYLQSAGYPWPNTRVEKTAVPLRR
jgi:Protein of unknown function (DUF2971)